MIVFLWKISRQFYRLRLNLGWIGKTEARTWEKRVLLQTSDGRCPSFDHTVPGRQCFNSPILRAEKPASRKTQSCISNSLTFWHSWGTSDATLPYIFPGSPSLSQASRSKIWDLLSAPWECFTSFSCSLFVPLQIQIRWISFCFPLRLPLDRPACLTISFW